ncbi:MAG: hypothetical protein WDO68_21905 [Gammaproteobacteria bacterium]
MEPADRAYPRIPARVRAALWPVTVVAALLSDALVSSSDVAVPLSVAVCLWIGVIYGALAAILRRLDLAGPLLSARAAGRMAVATVVASSVVAIGYVGIFVAAGDVSTEDALRGAARYGMADMNGILMLTPLLILVGHWPHRVDVLRSHWREAVLQGALVLATLLVVFFPARRGSAAILLPAVVRADHLDRASMADHRRVVRGCSRFKPGSSSRPAPKSIRPDSSTSRCCC